MANTLYAKGREALLEGSIDMLTDTIKAVLLSATYVANLLTDQFYSTLVSSGGIIAGPVALSGRSGQAGTFSAANITFPAVSSVLAQGTQLVIYKDTGTTTTSPLIGYINVASGLPVTPDNGDLTFAFPSSQQVFTL